MSVRRRIILHGSLRDRCPEIIELEADTVAEAINGFCRMKKNVFLPNFTENTRPVIRVVGFDTYESLYEKSDVRDLHLVPAFNGGKSGFIQIIIGIVLVVAAFYTGGLSLTLLGTDFAVSASTMLLVGASLIVGGLLQTLFPVKLANTTPDESNYLGAPQNTVKVGTRIPLLFGTTMAWGQFLSANTVAIDLNP